jgi:cell division protein FtsQ
MTATISNPGRPRPANRRRTSRKKRRYQHLLDTGVRSSEADRQRRRRWLGWFAKLFILAALLVGGYLGARRLIARTILENTRYNIAELDVDTDGVLKPEDILEKADLHKGTNIFQVDLAKAQALVAAIPQVEKVSVSRQLPNRVAIQVSERKPIAWVAPTHGTSTRDEVVASKFSWFVDANGILLRPRKLNAQDRFLPIIRNYGEGPFFEGQEATGEEMKAALDLIRAQQESLNTARFQIAEIDLARHFGLTVTDRNGLQVLFGLDEMDHQLKRLDVYLQAIDQRGQKPQSINLLVERNVPVTFAVDAIALDKPATGGTPAASPTPVSASGPSAGKDKAREKSKDKPAAKTKASATKPANTTAPNSSSHKAQPFLGDTVKVRKAQAVDAGHN